MPKIATIIYNRTTLLAEFTVMAVAFILLLNTVIIQAQSQLDSTNYRILDPTIDSGGGTADSGTENYSLLTSTGVAGADERLESTSYALGSGFPSGIQANVPLIRCAETDTLTVTTDCITFPNDNGAQGECGEPGCYDRAKVEIDPQNNPIDTLFLVRVVDNLTTTTYFLQSDHTLATTYDIGDYMTICELEGYDPADTSCDDSGDGNWDEALQSANIYNLAAGRSYTISARALSGDFTETQFSPTVNFTTELPALVMDIDIGTSSAADTNSPYAVSLGVLSTAGQTTATNQIWLDLGTNAVNGMNTYVRGLNGALVSGAHSIPSEVEDVNTDPNNNGGFGFKVQSWTQTALGPLQASSNYNTGTAHSVGSLTTLNKLIFFTNTTGANVGPLTQGRANIAVKARAQVTTPAGAYTETASFSMVGTF